MVTISHADPELMQPGARLEYLRDQINGLDADIVGLQEADKSLAEVFEGSSKRRSFWAPKGLNKPDGCRTLVKSNIEVAEHESHLYDDRSGYVFQLTRIGRLAIANTHIKWAPEDDPNHIGVSQTQELLSALNVYKAAVILADCNGRPGGRVQTMVEEAGFTSLSGERQTAIVNGELVAIDLLAIKGLKGMLVPNNYDLHAIPNEICASDHAPVIAEVTAE